MRGIPKWFNTREDELNSMAVDKDATKAKLQEMLDGRFVWVAILKLGDNADGIEDATHKVLTQREMEGGQEERFQYELQEDPNAWIILICLTVEEINNLIGA